MHHVLFPDIGASGTIPVPVTNATSFVGADFRESGVGTAAPPIPAYAVPTGTQKDVALAWLTNSVNATLPTVPPGWNLVLDNAGAEIGAVVGAACAGRWIWKYLTSGSEVFGAPANATRTVVWVYRFSNAPANPIVKLTKDVKGSGVSPTQVRHPAHTLQQGGGANLICATVVKVNVTGPAERTGLAAEHGIVGATGGKTLWGRSPGPVTSWAQQLGAIAAFPDGVTATESIASVLELAA